eukprot:8484302-Pyramimonas_sp.AAC.1
MSEPVQGVLRCTVGSHRSVGRQRLVLLRVASAGAYSTDPCPARLPRAQPWTTAMPVPPGPPHEELSKVELR